MQVFKRAKQEIEPLRRTPKRTGVAICSVTLFNARVAKPNSARLTSQMHLR